MTEGSLIFVVSAAEVLQFMAILTFLGLHLTVTPSYDYGRPRPRYQKNTEACFVLDASGSDKEAGQTNAAGGGGG